MRRPAATWAAAVLAALLSGPPSAAELRPLTLYQKTARASLVVRARATSDSTRRPQMEVLEIFKGSYPHTHLYIVPFRQDYASEKPWLRSEVFRKGREYLLFLRPYDPDEEDDDFAVETPSGGQGGVDPMLFEVLNAHHGVVDVPSEGAEALASAVRRFSGIITLQDYDTQARELRALLRESNPYAVEAGLHQVSEYDLAEGEDLDALVSLLDSPRISFRAGALKIIGQLVPPPGTGEHDVARSRRALDLVVARAFNDPAEEVREQAVRSLGRIGGPAAREVLRRISRQDPSQIVRYRAEVALAEMAGILSPPRR